MTSYETIFERFLRKIEDVKLAQLNETDRTKMLIGWLDDALATMELDNIHLDFDYNDRQDMQFNSDLSNTAIQIISLYMVVAWYEPIVNSLSHTLTFYGSKDDNREDSNKHLASMQATQDKYHNKAKSLYTTYRAQHNSYLEKEK